MDNFFHSSSSYGDSGDSSSPHSRDTTDQSCENNAFSSCNDRHHNENEQPPPPCTGADGKVKFMCSYGGKIAPRPHDHRLAYLGGHTKILVVHRYITFASILAKLSSFYVDDAKVVLLSFRYQLPGEDLDALVSVTNDEDLHHMMLEYDRLTRASPKLPFPKLRLFSSSPSYFQLRRPITQRVKEDPNSTFVSLDKGGVPTSTMDTDQDHIQLTQTMMISGQEQEAAFQRNSNENTPSTKGAFNGDLYDQNMILENTLAPSASALLVPTTLQIPTTNSYWQNNVHLIGNGAYNNKGTEQQRRRRQPVYLIPATADPVTNQVNHGYHHHPMQSILMQDVYSVGTVPPQVQHIVGMYGEGGGLFRPPAGVAAADEGYVPAAYDNAGSHVYYEGASGGVIAASYQTVMGAAVDLRMPLNVNAENKKVVEPSESAAAM